MPKRINFVNKLGSTKSGYSATSTLIFSYIQLVFGLHQLLLTLTQPTR